MMKQKHPRAAALQVARELCAGLTPHTERLIVAGSLRRRKAEVGDVELLYIPRYEGADDLFGDEPHNMTEDYLETLVASGVLAKRIGENGGTGWGAKNKLAVHVETGIAVDLFATTEDVWWNYLVCRTGPAESNMAIAQAAREKGWHWHPYGRGFSRGSELHWVQSEREVFDFVGLPYREPWER